MQSLFLYISVGKPNPPSFISLQRGGIIEGPFTYKLGYSTGHYCPSKEDGTTYVTEILVQYDLNMQLCTCYRDYHYCYLNFDTTEWGLNLLATYEKTLSFRVALNVNGVLSDFLPFVNQTTDSCKESLVVDSKSIMLRSWGGGCRKFLLWAVSWNDDETEYKHPQTTYWCNSLSRYSRSVTQTLHYVECVLTIVILNRVTY